MKKILISLLIGFASHMLYLDTVMVIEHKKADACFAKYKGTPNEDADSQKCIDDFNSMNDRWKVKYFGIYKLFKYANIVIVHGWSMD